MIGSDPEDGAVVLDQVQVEQLGNDRQRIVARDPDVTVLRDAVRREHNGLVCDVLEAPSFEPKVEGEPDGQHPQQHHPGPRRSQK